MDVASLSEIKRELRELPHEKLTEICLRTARFRKENKELLNYLLFESYDEENYKEQLKREIEAEFKSVNAGSVYLAKKSIRRILKMVNKHIKFSDQKQTEIEVLIFFCRKMQEIAIPFRESRVLTNLYNRQLLLINKALDKLQDDLRYDYQSDIDEIS